MNLKLKLNKFFIAFFFFIFMFCKLEATIVKINDPEYWGNQTESEFLPKSTSPAPYVPSDSIQKNILSELKNSLFFLGLIIGIIVFLYIRPKHKCRNAKAMARRWLAWGSMASIATGSSQIVAKGAEGGFPAAMLGISFFSGAAWLFGYLFGLTKFWLMPNTSVEPIVEEQIYAKVAQELADNQINSGVMARAFSQSNGDENKAKALYIKFRVKQLILNCHDEVKRSA